MPIELVQSGPAFLRGGVEITPMAEKRSCDGCGSENAPFGIITGNRREAYCGWKDGKAQCLSVRRNEKSKDAA
jgi:hypothetical protein